MMPNPAVTPSPGFISITVSDIDRSASFYEHHLGAVRDTFDFGAGGVAFVGWPTYALNSTRPLADGAAGSSPIQLWWRASNVDAVHDRAIAEGVPILAAPMDGPFGRTFTMADPDGYRVTVYERDQPLFWPPKRP
jgi:predicted enzyme related to lactoylglutathione lyase